jgi:antitoxin CptB
MVMDQKSLPEFGQLKWECRRGVLELDILLDPFLYKTYPYLSKEEKYTFVALLAYPDDVLLSWFFGDESPKSPDLQNIIEIVRVSQTG